MAIRWAYLVLFNPQGAHLVRCTGRTGFRYGNYGSYRTVVSNLCIAQIISPHDNGISASISANLDPKRWDTDAVLEDPLCIDRTREMVEAYFDHIAHLSEHK